MVVAVPLELLASPLKSGRDLGGGDRSALVIGGSEKIRTGRAVVFCKVVAVAEAQVRRDGQVRAKGSPVHHGTLGPLEEKAGPGVIGGIAGRVPLGARFVKGQRERLGCALEHLGAAAMVIGRRFGLQHTSPWALINVLTGGRLLAMAPAG
jgi:hypothetical protein